MTTFATQATVALEEAIRYAEHGYALTPVTITRAASGKKQAKFHRGWRHENAWSSDPDQIRAWWVDHPDTSFAIGCAVNGIEGVDLDVKPAEGIDSVSWWAERSLPMGRLCQDTPSGGRHTIWAVRSDGRSLPQEAGKTLGRGIDTRNRSGLFFAAGAYVLGEPGNYTVAGDLPHRHQLTTTPDEVLQLFAAAEQQERAERPADGRIIVHQLEWQQRMVGAALDAIVTHPKEEGGYRKKLQHAGLFLGRVVEQKLLTLGEATARLTNAHMSVWGPSIWPENLKDIRDALADGPALERWRAPEEVHADEQPQVSAAPNENDGVPESVNHTMTTLGEQVDPSEPGSPGPTDDQVTDEEIARRVFEREVEHKQRQLRVAQVARDRLAAEKRPPTPPPGSVSLRELLARPRTEAKYLVDQMWPAKGKVLITAPKKSGKTTLVGNLIRSLVDGDRFLSKPYAPGDWRAATAGYGVAEPDGRVVMLLDFEMTELMLTEWLEEQRIREQDAVHVELMRGRTWDIRDDDIRAGWAAYLRDLNVGKLIIDPIGPIIHGLGIPENDNSEVGRFLGALDMLAREAGIDEYAAVHHAGHGEEQRSRGASAFLGWSDATWQITRSEAGSFIQAEGRDVSMQETALVFDRATRRLSLGEGNRVSSKASAHSDVVAEIVKESEGLTWNKLKAAVREAAGIGTPAAEDAIRAAVKAGFVHTHPGANRALTHYPSSRCDHCPCVTPGDPK